MSTSFALITQSFPENRVVYLGYVKAATGLGLMMGPAVGSVIYGFKGYAPTFYFFSIFIFLSMILQGCFIPYKLNKPKDEVLDNLIN